MNPSAVMNALTRRIELMFPGLSQPVKHNHYKDFGWPSTLSFSEFFTIYHRNSLAKAAVDKTVLKCWETTPELWEIDDPKETKLEVQIRQRFEDVSLWQMMSLADGRSLVGGWAGLIIRIRDGLALDQPMARVGGGLEAIVELIPAWGGDQSAQLSVAEWDTNQLSEDYGKPKMFRFNEQSTDPGNPGKVRQFMVHPSRVIVFSKDGTVGCRSALEAGYNDLIDAEKVKGAGGEGFYKSARGNPILELKDGLDIRKMAKDMGVEPRDLPDVVNEQVDAYQSGFDKMLMIQGMTAKNLAIGLPQGDSFFNAPVNLFAASFGIPVKILLGSQTGERASTEDSKEWARTCDSRRRNELRPRIMDFVRRLVAIGILPVRDWKLNWLDLSGASPDEKMARAVKMAEINAKQRNEPVWLPEEIRLASGDASPMPDIGDDENDDEDGAGERQDPSELEDDPQGDPRGPGGGGGSERDAS